MYVLQWLSEEERDQVVYDLTTSEGAREDLIRIGSRLEELQALAPEEWDDSVLAECLREVNAGSSLPYQVLGDWLTRHGWAVVRAGVEREAKAIRAALAGFAAAWERAALQPSWAVVRGEGPGDENVELSIVLNERMVTLEAVLGGDAEGRVAAVLLKSPDGRELPIARETVRDRRISVSIPRDLLPIDDGILSASAFAVVLE